MYKLKQLPEDFIVREIADVPVRNSGRYLYIRLTKKGWNTLDVVKKLSAILNIPEKKIGFAGSKDKHALTEQMLSLDGVGKDRIAMVQISDVHLQFLGYADVPLSLGDLKGNAFEIVVRNLEHDTIVTPISQVENYFDEQRFGTSNMAIGRQLIKKDFFGALQLIDNPLCQRYLKHYPNDAVGALKKLPTRLLRLYINSYQSYIWNETLALYLRRKGKIIKEVPYSDGILVFTKEIYPNLEIPLVGFNTPTSTNAEINTIIADLIKQQNVTTNDFIIKQIPELTLEGEMRKGFAEIADLKIDKFENDELNAGKKKVLISFALGKGSYATMVIRTILNYNSGTK